MHATPYLHLIAVVPVGVVLQALLSGESEEASSARIAIAADTVDLPLVLLQLADGGEGLAAELSDFVAASLCLFSSQLFITLAPVKVENVREVVFSDVQCGYS